MFFQKRYVWDEKQRRCTTQPRGTEHCPQAEAKTCRRTVEARRSVVMLSVVERENHIILPFHRSPLVRCFLVCSFPFPLVSAPCFGALSQESPSSRLSYLGDARWVSHVLRRQLNSNFLTNSNSHIVTSHDWPGSRLLLIPFLAFFLVFSLGFQARA